MVPESMVSSRLIVRHSVDLPAAGGPDDDDDLAATHGQVDVLEHVQRAEVLVDASELHEGVGGLVGRGGRCG